MKQTKTLAQVANDIENRENLNEYQNNETAIKMGNFDSFADFLSYYRQHYRPLLQAIENGENIDDSRRHLLNFLASDLLQMFADSDEDSESDTEAEDSNTTDTDEPRTHLLLCFRDTKEYERACTHFRTNSDYYADREDDEFRTLYFPEEDSMIDQLEGDIDAELCANEFTGYHFESE